ncbi:MAG: hypothetical protein IPK87_12295 [Planctomycetes bacterium]|nr:hypothetical protein [Planctomycetota bacterium]
MTTQRFTFVFVLLLTVAACGGGNSPLGAGSSPDYSTPEATMRSLIAAKISHDAEAAAECWVASEREAKLESYRTTYSVTGSSGNPGLKFERVENKLGYTLGVYSVPSTAGRVNQKSLALVNENGQWKCSEAQWQKFWKALLQEEKR